MLRHPIAAVVLLLSLAAPARGQSLSPSLVDAITEAFNRVGALHSIPYGPDYTLMVGGKLVTGNADYFLRRRTGAEVLASGMTDGCGDNALATLAILEQHGFKTYFVDSAQISTESIQNNFSGHAVVAVWDPKVGLWVRVDTTRRNFSYPWTETDKAFYGNYWIGFRGKLADYPAHDPESLKKFYRDTLNTVPAEVFDRTLFKFRFIVDQSMIGPGGAYRNPNLKRFLADNGKILAAHNIHPTSEVTVRLMNGEDNAESRCEYSQSGHWGCLVGQRSALSLGFLTYLEGRVNDAREKGEAIGAVPATATVAPEKPVWWHWPLAGVLSLAIVALVIWQRRRLAERQTAIAYWGCQLLGWGGLVAVAVAKGALEWKARDVGSAAFLFFGGIAITHALRLVMRRHKWLSLPTGRMVRRFAIAVLVQAAILSVLQNGYLITYDLATHAPPYSYSSLVSSWLGATTLFIVWVGLYVLLTGPRRQREMQVQFQLALREAELRALEAQLNPHFLFNCLNSIRGLVVENPARSQDMLTRLANILRYNLRRDVEHTVPLSSEVEIVGDYLAIESARFEERLRIHMAIEPAAGDVQVPPMLLQSLVENALKHGIAPLPGGGDLSIRAKMVGDAMLMEVENPGQIAQATADSTNTGLANIRERLRILYNGRATFELKNHAGRVTAEVLVPRTA